MSTTSSNRNKIIAAIVLILIIVVGAGWYVTQQPTGPTTTTATATTPSGLPVPNTDTLVEETTREPGPGGYDPALTWDAGGNMIMENVYETLMTFDGPRADKFIPWLAESWEVSPDGLVYTFHLRKGIMFHDGTPFNATAVKFSLDRAILINHADGPQFLIAPVETMAIKGGPRYFTANTVHNYNASEAKIYLAQEGVKVLDLYTVQITLEHPYAAVVATMAFTVTGIVSPSYVITNCQGSAEMPGVTPGIECEWMMTHGAGTGPFKIVEATPKVRMVLERFDDYWGGPTRGGPAKLKRYIIKYVPEIGTREVDLYAGTADAIQLPGTNAFDLIDKDTWLKSGTIKPLKAGISVWSKPTIVISAMILNPRFPPLDNIEFRQALAYAFPYDKYIAAAVNGFGVKLNNLIPPGMFGYDPSLPSYSYNPDMARQLFQEVGYKGTLDITIQSGDAETAAAMLLLKDSLAEVAPDVNIKISEVDTATGLTLYHQVKMQISVGGPFGAWFPDIADPAETVANWATQAGFRAQMAGFQNDTITRMVIEAGSTLDTTRRMELYREIQLEMFRKVPYIFLYNPVALMAERDWVLPPDSPIGRGVYNPEYGDGSGGLQGGYHAYSIWKAETTPEIAIIIGNSPLGAESPFVTTTVFAVCPSRTY